MQYSKVFRVPVTNMERASKGVSLSPEDSDFLRKHTKYSEEDIKVWFRSFKKDCPSGILEKKKVNEIYEEKIVPNTDCKYLVDQLFRTLDDDNNGGIDFKVWTGLAVSSSDINVVQEFMLAVNMAVSGSKEEKLSWMFK